MKGIPNLHLLQFKSKERLFWIDIFDILDQYNRNNSSNIYILIKKAFKKLKKGIRCL